MLDKSKFMYKLFYEFINQGLSIYFKIFISNKKSNNSNKNVNLILI
jgi:hypothetical protein